MKKKKYCAQRHLNKSQVMSQIMKAISVFQTKGFSDVQILSCLKQAVLGRIAVSSKALVYSPQKGWIDVKKSGFSGECVAWIAAFSLSGQEKACYAVYKIKNGEKLLLYQEDLEIKEYLFGSFWIGRHSFVYTQKGNHAER